MKEVCVRYIDQIHVISNEEHVSVSKVYTKTDGGDMSRKWEQAPVFV